MNLLFRSIAVFLAVSLAAMPVVAQSGQAAMLYPRNAVTVNGAAVKSATAITDGSQIATSEKASASLLSQGSNIVLDRSSAVTYAHDALQLNEGAVVVSTSAGFGARLGDMNIAPEGTAPARFAVVSREGKQVIAALKGNLRITEGSQSLTLQSGQSMTRVSSAAMQAGHQNVPGVGEGAATQTSSAFARGFPGWAIALLAVGVSGAVIGGLAAAGTFSDDDPASPVVP